MWNFVGWGSVTSRGGPKYDLGACEKNKSQFSRLKKLDENPLLMSPLSDSLA